MTRQRASALAWSLWAACVALALTMASLGLSGPIPHEGGYATLGLALLGCATIGALLASRRRENNVGWVLLTIAFVAEVGAAIDGYANSGLLSEGGLDSWIGLVAGNIDFIWIGLAGIVLPLIFPTGRLPSPRWRAAVWLGAAAILLLTFGQVLRPGRLDLSHTSIDNPLGISGADTVLSVVVGIGTVVGAACFIAAIAAVFARLRRAHGEERLQLKWFTYVLALVGSGLVVAAIEAPFRNLPAWAEAIGSFGWFLMLSALVFGLPIAAGVAIFRYRLYDIDVVINRTLVYGGLTVILAAVYVGSVLLLELVLRPVTAQSALAVAASTLAVAALFQPLRWRIQQLVDRRFYRHRYDARRTLEAFSARLRDEVDLETLRIELGAVVTETMQPAHVSLWLPTGERPR